MSELWNEALLAHKEIYERDKFWINHFSLLLLQAH